MLICEFEFSLGNVLLAEGYLQETPVQSGFGSTVDLTSKGNGWISSGRTELMLTTNRELLALEAAQAKPDVTLAPRYRMQYIYCNIRKVILV